MCGLVGVIGGSFNHNERMARVERMKTSLAHRGPDGEGVYADPEGFPVAFGHKRLAIIDPEHGGQPMTTSDGMITLIFNGAIYNYLELRRELISKNHNIHTYSDTEVILHSYTEWGEKCVERFNGMFALAIWDKRNNILFCARDRIGIKPFYYYKDGEVFAFGSEIKAILAGGFTSARINPNALQDYLTFQFYLGGKTLFSGIQELEPGHTLSVKPNGDSLKFQIRKYWDVEYDIDDKHDEDYFVDFLSYLIDDAVRIQLRSDVPIGAHLSGGLDSSAIVCIASSLLEGIGFKTFTGAFREGSDFDETTYARTVADFAGSEYHEIYIPGEEFSGALTKLIYHMDHPLAGPGLFPQYYVSKLASEHVKVVLGGQGGDELFIGYARYLVAYLEKCISGAIYQTADTPKYAVSLASIIPNLPVLQKYAPMLQMFWSEGLFEEPDRRYFRLIDRSEGMRRLFAKDIFSEGYSSFNTYREIFNKEGLHSFINRMTYFDIKGSLPALLHVEDRTSMAVSLESRVPLLDHRIIELMAKMPPNIKFSQGRMKHLLKEAVKNKVPEAILGRKDKMGFPVPLNQWYDGVAKEFVIDTLTSQRARQRGIYDVKAVKKFISEEKMFGRVVWGILCMELWHLVFVDGENPV